MPLPIFFHYTRVLNSTDEELIETNDALMKSFPYEIALEIFSHFNLATLGKCCLVSRTWNKFTHLHNSDLWKIALYRERAFSDNKWKDYCGENVVEGEVPGEDFVSFPHLKIISDYRKLKEEFPEENLKNKFMLVRVPKTLSGRLSLKNLDALLKRHSLNQYSIKVESNILALVKKITLNRSVWVLMTKGSLKKSTNIPICDQVTLVENFAKRTKIPFEIPEILTSYTCILSHYFKTYTLLFNKNRCTMMSGTVSSIYNHCVLYIHSLYLKGTCTIYRSNGTWDKDIGIGAMRIYEEDLKVNDNIDHKEFGPGIIASIIERPNRIIYTIFFFKDHRSRSISVNEYVNPQRILQKLNVEHNA